MINYATIPVDVRNSIDAWVTRAIPPGSFVTAVLENNLSEAFAHADDWSLDAMHSIVAYVYNEIPSPCWGSAEKMKAWRERFAPQTVRP